MKKLVVSAVMVVIGVTVYAAKPAAPVPASAVFGPGLFSDDGGGPYINGVDCVGSSYAAASGDYTFRTASHVVGQCEANLGPWARKVQFDLSQQVVATSDADCADGIQPSDLSIDVCGTTMLNDLRLAPSALFARGTVSTQVTAFISQHPELNDTEFVLTYHQPVTVSADGTARRLSCTAGGCDADLHHAVKQFNKKGLLIGYTLEFLGVWRVPIVVAVTPLP